MTDKTITITLTGPEEVVVPSLDAFVKQYGWQEQVSVAGEMVDNPQTREEKARLIIRQFIIDTVKAYNVEQARIAAASAAGTQTDQAIELTSMSLTLG